MAKNLIDKYVWLVETIYKSGRITLKEINAKWKDDQMGGKSIPSRTFHKWRIAVEEMFNLAIECDRIGGYHYYIDNVDEIKRGGFRNWLLSTISVSNLLLQSRSLKDRILLESVPSGQVHLADILEAMKQNTKLRITYRSFNRDESATFTVLPYAVKLFHQRWYLVAYNPYYEKVLIYGLDRISQVTMLSGEKFAEPDDFDAAEFFRHYYGIVAGTGRVVETVKLKVSSGQANYLRSLPLHATQQEVEKTDEHSVFTLQICPEYDFQQAILSHGEDVEVLEPAWLRNEIAGKVNRLCNKYNKK